MQISKVVQSFIKNKTVSFWTPTCILIALTFPVVTGDFVYGLDASYFWAHNYIFDSGKFHNESALIYGPLAFLRHPSAVGNNMIYGVLCLTVIKALIAFFTFLVNSKYKNWNLIIVFIVLYFLFTISTTIGYLLLDLVLLLI